MSDHVPPLAERERPGLSETLTGPKAPDRCQACGAGPRPPRTDVDLVAQRFSPLPRWLECDAWDQKTHTVVVLCEPCGTRLIDPHPRLYHPLPADQPHPGCMPICLDCTHREGVRCTHPQAKANRGTGVMLHFRTPPAQMHLCGTRNGRRFGEWRTIYAPVEACRQKTPVTASPAERASAPAQQEATDV